MGLRSLAESIILQALEDLDDPDQRTESLSFFHGHRFRLFARLAGIPKEDLYSFHSYAMQYASAVFRRECTRSPIDRKRSSARMALMYSQPLFVHMLGRC